MAPNTRWKVWRAKADCMAVEEETCPEGQFCQPRLPYKLQCPGGVALEQAIFVTTLNGTDCVLESAPATSIACPLYKPEPSAGDGSQLSAPSPIR